MLGHLYPRSFGSQVVGGDKVLFSYFVPGFCKNNNIKFIFNIIKELFKIIEITS